MQIEQIILDAVGGAIKELYGAEADALQITLQKTKKEFRGHYTLVTFPLLRVSRKSPEQTAEEIGRWLLEQSPVVSDFNVIKGFLNLTIAPSIWVELLQRIDATQDFGFTPV